MRFKVQVDPTMRRLFEKHVPPVHAMVIEFRRKSLFYIYFILFRIFRGGWAGPVCHEGVVGGNGSCGRFWLRSVKTSCLEAFCGPDGSQGTL